ncbi:MAG: glycosyltransferase family 4 protein [Bacteroides sp.]|nr:glycosyltransferase family 4 protein [Bacteroides sp.]MCM1378663.1 glycosyltransferase family 4 protein [Bacteroides sp.]MCM1444936.1 glycosyltransferase family 4 protein [Prevotella sp.]
MSQKPKRIVIEALAVGLIPCGLREYAFQVCKRLVQQRPKTMQFVFIVPPGMSGCFGSGAEYIECSDLKAKLLRRMPIVKGDLFHALHQICAVKHLPGIGKQLVTVHDINFCHTKTGRSYRHAEGRFVSRMRYATHLAFISRFVAEDVSEHFPYSQPSKVIYNGVTTPDASKQTKPKTLDGSIKDGFLLHLSSLDMYKNTRLLIEMMKYLPDQLLVIAGNCKDTKLKEIAQKHPNVIILGKVGEEEKNWLYYNCLAFLFPSKAEGFGLPPLEAMSIGKPVFLSTLTSLPEVGGNFANYWTELEPEKMATFLDAKLNEPFNPEALKRHAAMFSWDNTAADYIKYYSEILGI